MTKINKFLLGLVIVLVLAILVIFGVWYWKNIEKNSFYAVYLDTGDLYFGQLSKFPSLSLSNVWYLQRDSQNQGVALMDFSKAAWKPEGKIKINRDRVVWISKISQDSPIISVMLGKESMDENGLPQSQSQSTLSPTPSITPNP